MTEKVTTVRIERNKGITQALKKLVKEQNMIMSDGSISQKEWSAALDEIDRIQDKRLKEGKSIFTGGRDRGTDYHRNYIVKTNQTIDFTQDEISRIYSALGVSFSNTEHAEDKNVAKESPDVTDLPVTAAPADSTGKDSTVVAPVTATPADSTGRDSTVVAPGVNAPSDSAKTGKKPDWTTIGAMALAGVATAVAIVSHRNAKTALKTAKNAAAEAKNAAAEARNAMNAANEAQKTVTTLQGEVNKLNDTVTGLSDKIEGIGERVSQLEQTTSNININTIETNITTIVNQQLNTTKDELQNVTGDLINQIRKEGTNAVNMVNTAEQSAQNTLEQATRHSVGQVGEARRQATQNVGHAAGQFIGQVRKEGTNALNTLEQATRHSVGQVGEAGRQATQNVGHAAGQFIGQVRKEGTNAVNMVNAAEQTAQNTLEQATRHSVGQVGEAERQATQNVGHAVGQGIGQVRQERDEALNAIRQAQQTTNPINPVTPQQITELSENELENIARQHSYVPENFFSNESAKESAEVLQANIVNGIRNSFKNKVDSSELGNLVRNQNNGRWGARKIKEMQNQILDLLINAESTEECNYVLAQLNKVRQHPNEIGTLKSCVFDRLKEVTSLAA